MSSVLMFEQHFPKKGYKNLQNVYRETVPSMSRPAINGVNPGPGHEPSKGCFGRARPIKHWRKQLVPVKHSGINKTNVGMPTDTPGGAVLFNKKTKNDLDCRCETANKDSHSITTVKHILHPEHCHYCPDNSDAVSSCCNSKKNIIRTANTRIPLNNRYYSSTRGYLHAKCKTYDQNLGAQQTPVSSSNKTRFFSLTCPSGACGADSTTKPTHIYKPNNNQFQVQGAVSSGDRIARLKYNTIRTNAASFHNAFKTTTSSSLHSYAVNEAGPYFLKSKLNFVQDCRSSLPARMRRACPPKPPS